MARNTINQRTVGDEIKDEAIAASAINPGNLIEVINNSGVTEVQNHSTSDGIAAPTVAVEDDLQGKGITDAYAAASRVQYLHFAPGERALMHLANGENASIGDFLSSNGDGTLQVSTTLAIGIAKENIDMTDSSGADPDGTIIVEFI